MPNEPFGINCMLLALARDIGALVSAEYIASACVCAYLCMLSCAGTLTATFNLRLRRPWPVTYKLHAACRAATYYHVVRYHYW